MLRVCPTVAMSSVLIRLSASPNGMDAGRIPRAYSTAYTPVVKFIPRAWFGPT
jgi:hypothetical protein